MKTKLLRNPLFIFHNLFTFFKYLLYSLLFFGIARIWCRVIFLKNFYLTSCLTTSKIPLTSGEGGFLLGDFTKPRKPRSIKWNDYGGYYTFHNYKP